MKLFVVLSFVLFNFTAAFLWDEVNVKIDDVEEWSTTAAPCNVTNLCNQYCPRLKPFYCLYEKKFGCPCKNGYLRDPNSRRCIKKEFCPLFPKPRDNKEVLSTCAECHKDICSPHPKACKECSPGYVCENNFVRDLDTRFCVNLRRCDQEDCGENEEWSKCKNDCLESCVTAKSNCSSICQQGCTCKPGYLREPNSNKCILKQYCPNGDSKEMFSDCRAACQNTCNRFGAEFCTNCTAGYICKRGFVRDTFTGRCIRREFCPQPGNPQKNRERFSNCRAGCQRMCFPGVLEANCEDCIPGYVCSEGLARTRLGGKCVPIHYCANFMLKGERN